MRATTVAIRGRYAARVVLPVAVLLAVAPLAAGCGAGGVLSVDDLPIVPDETAPTGRVLDLDFEGSFTAPGAVVGRVESRGSEPVTITVATSAGGRITRARGFDSASALRFPAYSPGPTPAAVVLVRGTDADDLLSPGERPFLFGADVDLDAVSSGSPTDNGDNVVQRGLSAEDAQYKLQLDHGTPSCRVAGTAGVAFVAAPAPVQRGSWYRLTCRRSADTLTLVVRRLDESGPGAEQTTTVRAPTGSVRMDAGVPVSIGGKVAANGEITTSATDQLNGLVDNVRLELED